MSTYKDAGVDIDAGDRAVELMKASIAKASRPEVMSGIGGFAGLFDASKLKDMKQPLLATSTGKSERANWHITLRCWAEA